MEKTRRLTHSGCYLPMLELVGMLTLEYFLVVLVALSEGPSECCDE